MMRTLIRKSLLRILALIKKEILTILMDKKSRAVLFAPIIVQCIIFGYGASYHLENVPYAIYNQSNDSVSYEIEQELLKTPKFKLIEKCHTMDCLRKSVDSQKILQFIIQGDDLAVDLGADAAVADVGMDAVGEVDGNSPLGQVDDVAPRRKNEDFVGKSIELKGIDKFLGIARILPFQEVAQPAHLFIESILIGCLIAFFITPMSSNTVFGNAVHFPSTDLDFDGLPSRPDDRRVQGLIVIGLRHGDVVLEAVRQGLPQAVDDAQDAIAVLDVVDDDADGEKVIDLAQVAVIFLHLLINAVKMLGPAVDFAMDMGFVEGFLEDVDGFVDDFFADVALLLHLVDEVIVFIRFEIAEGQIFQFPFDIEDPQAVGQGRKEIGRAHV